MLNALQTILGAALFSNNVSPSLFTVFCVEPQISGARHTGFP